jgi:2-phospho-L-lactate/phosphoenolpyruvate guanylyltransferase
MTYKALIPVKSLQSVKSRLAPHLTLHQRKNLVLDMLYHVIHVLHASNVIEQVLVVSPDQHVLAQAKAWGAQARLEEMPGHNAALHAVALKEQPTSTAALLTISADLPLLHAYDISALVEQSVHHAVVLAASRDGTGTNAILTRPPLVLPYLFGPNSLYNYQQAARQLYLSYITYHSIGLALDIDTIDDLEDLYELQILSGEHMQKWLNHDHNEVPANAPCPY